MGAGKKKKKKVNDILQKLGDAWTLYNALLLIIGIVLFFCSLLAWGYVLSQARGSCRELLKVEAAVQAVILLGSFLRIGLLDYEDRFQVHVMITLAVDTVFSVIGFLVRDIHILEVNGTLESASFQYILDLLVQVLVGMVLGFLPALFIAALMWLLIHVFARQENR